MSPEELPPVLQVPRQVGLLLMRLQHGIWHGPKCCKGQVVPHSIPVVLRSVALSPGEHLRACSAPRQGCPVPAGSSRVQLGAHASGKGKNFTCTSTLSPNIDGKRNALCLPEATSAAGGFMLRVSILLAGKDY